MVGERARRAETRGALAGTKPVTPAPGRREFRNGADRCGSELTLSHPRMVVSGRSDGAVSGVASLLNPAYQAGLIEETFMISQTAEYALRAVVYLASAHGTPQTTAQISEAAQLPAGYLAKVMQQLTRAGLVASQRGLHGGFTLARDPAKLTILEVVTAVDGSRRFRECPLGIQEHGVNLCPLHRRLDEAAATVEKAFAASVVAELLPSDPESGDGCEFPSA